MTEHNRNKYPELDAMPMLLTIPEVARVLRVSPDTIRGRIRAGAIPSLRLGNRDRIPREAVRDLLTNPVNQS